MALFAGLDLLILRGYWANCGIGLMDIEVCSVLPLASSHAMLPLCFGQMEKASADVHGDYGLSENSGPLLS